MVKAHSIIIIQDFSKGVSKCLLECYCVQASLKCPDYQGVLIFQVSLHVNGYFGTITKCPDYGGVLIFKGPD